MSKKTDRDTEKGTAVSLRHAFSIDSPKSVHLGALAAEMDFAVLRSQLNDPPPQYRKASK